MFFKKINIAQELEKEKKILEEANKILENLKVAEDRIIKRIKEGNKEDSQTFFLLSKTGSKIYTGEAIRNICVKYRLRFLNTKFYQGELPYEALQKIKETEKKYQVRLSDFKIMAPAEKFLLKDSRKDPLLFVPAGNGQFFLVHQWGNDLNWLRKIINYPFRNIITLALTSLVFSLLVSLFLPEEIFSLEVQSTLFLILLYKILFFCIFSSFVFLLSVIYGITTAKDFSENIWDSEYFN